MRFLIGFFILLNFVNSKEEAEVVRWRQIDRDPLDVLHSLLELHDVNIQLGSTNGLTNSERRLQLPTPHRKSIGTEELLYKELLDPRHYEPNVRPTENHSKRTNVTFGFLLNQDERNQKLTTRCWLNVNWLDKRLSWNSSQWEGIKQIYVPYQKIWRPDIALVNNAVQEYSFLSTDVMITEEGNVTWLFSALYKSNCAIKVRYYPFDEQECSLKFASWSHDLREIDVGITTEKGDLSSYMNNSEFDLIEMRAQRTIARFPTDNSSLWPTIVISIRMRRRPLFYVFNHILPCVLISSMALLGFFMPPETGEKINMLTTVLICLATISESISESIPPSSEAVPLIGMYYVASLFIVCLATAANVLTLNTHRHGQSNQGRQVPQWLERFVLGYLASLLCMTIHEPDSVTLLRSSQSRLATLRRSSLMRDLKKSKNLEYRNAGSRDQLCECLRASPRLRKRVINEERQTGESAFLNRVLEDQIIPRLQSDRRPPPLVAQFEERFKRILKRVYRSLQQTEIREEVLDERGRISWQWQNLAKVVDRLLLVLFVSANITILLAFAAMPSL